MVKPLIYSLLVLSSPVSGNCSRSAAEFAHRLIARGHSIHRVFFLDTGVVTASATNVFPQDEPSPDWVGLAQQHAVELSVCISSALRYGVLDEEEAARHQRVCATIDPAFTIAGLGQLIDACAHSDRVITFGG